MNTAQNSVLLHAVCLALPTFWPPSSIVTQTLVCAITTGFFIVVRRMLMGKEKARLEYLLNEIRDCFEWGDKSELHIITHIKNAILNLRTDLVVLKRELEDVKLHNKGLRGTQARAIEALQRERSKKEESSMKLWIINWHTESSDRGFYFVESKCKPTEKKVQKFLEERHPDEFVDGVWIYWGVEEVTPDATL